MINIADKTLNLAGWLLKLSEYDFDVVNCPRVKSQAADALLHLKIDGLDHGPMHDDIHTLLIEQKPITVLKHIHDESSDEFCKKGTSVGMPGLQYNVASSGLVIRQASINKAR